MAVLVSLVFDVTADQYDAVQKALNTESDPPDGFMAHFSEDLGGKMKIGAVWESADAFGAFAQSRLGPTIAETLGDDAPELPEPQFTELHDAFTA
jgi:hypothetical protein